MARLLSQEEIEANAREFYRTHVELRHAKPRPAKLLNLGALVQFMEPQVIEWDGLRYRGPPVSFRLGTQLMVAAHALQDLRLSGAAPPVRLAAARVALACLQPHLKGPWYHRRFTSTDPEEVEAMAWRVLYVPDDGVLPPAEGAVTMDYMDTLAAFARDFPAWCGKDGLPLSWGHYQYGLRHLIRARHREDLRTAMAVRAAGADKKGYQDFESQWRAAAGWH